MGQALTALTRLGRDPTGGDGSDPQALAVLHRRLAVEDLRLRIEERRVKLMSLRAISALLLGLRSTLADPSPALRRLARGVFLLLVVLTSALVGRRRAVPSPADAGGKRAEVADEKVVGGGLGGIRTRRMLLSAPAPASPLSPAKIEEDLSRRRRMAESSEEEDDDDEEQVAECGVGVADGASDAEYATGRDGSSLVSGDGVAGGSSAGGTVILRDEDGTQAEDVGYDEDEGEEYEEGDRELSAEGGGEAELKDANDAGAVDGDVVEGPPLPLVVILSAWQNADSDEQTNPRELYEVLQGEQVEPWLDFYNHSQSTPATYLDLVGVLRRASMVIAFVSAEFVADPTCVKAFQLAANGLDLPIVSVVVGERDLMVEQVLEESALGSLLSEYDQFNAQDGYTDALLDDLLKNVHLALNLPTHHPVDVQALLTACEAGDLDRAYDLLNSSSTRLNPNASDPVSGHTPLWRAARSSQSVVVTLLLDHGADATLHLGTDASTALHAAASQPSHSVVTALLSWWGDLDADDVDRGAISDYITAKDAAGNTAIHLAALNDHAETLTTLLSKLRDEALAAALLPNNDGSTALHLAAQSGSLHSLTNLLDHVALFFPDDDNASLLMARDDAGTTPLHAAAWGGHAAACAVLLARAGPPGSPRTADMVRCLSGDGSTPMHLAVLGEASGEDGNGGGGVEELLVVLMAHDAPGMTPPLDEVADGEGMTALHLACAGSNADAVKCIARSREARGAGVAEAGGDGRTPAHLAAGVGAVDCLRVVARGGEDTRKADVEGWTPLHAAAATGAEDCVAWLLEVGGDGVAGILDRDGRAAAHVAAQYGHDGVLAMLAEVGGVEAVAVLDSRGRTCAHYAVAGCLEGGGSGWKRAVRCLKAIAGVWEGGLLVASDEGMTAMDEAEAAGEPMVIAFLNGEEVDDEGASEDEVDARLDLENAGEGNTVKEGVEFGEEVEE
ncbi:hypothetical protein HK101_000523 [Irineochytrium annulatum]|nr:hypothetical protein HK101_000523 [Irineochytrium annulatum]